jgi:hypothetical protein
MNKFLAIKLLIACVAGVLSCGWIWYLFWLGKGQGLVNMDPWIMILDVIVVSVLGFLAVALNTKIAPWVLGGWLCGQALLFTWDAIPHGRQPQPFEPVGFGENLVFSFITILILNWSIIPGAGLGYFLRYLLNRKTPAAIK